MKNEENRKKQWNQRRMSLTARFQKRIKTLKEKTRNEIPKKTFKTIFFHTGLLGRSTSIALPKMSIIEPTLTINGLLIISDLESYFVVEVIFSNSSTFSYNIKKRFPFFEVLYFRFPSWYSKSPFWTRRVRYSFIWLKEMKELYIILVIPAPPSWVADFKIAATMSVLLLYFNIHIIW